MAVEVTVLQNALDYSYGYDTDLTCTPPKYLLPPTHTPTDVRGNKGPDGKIAAAKVGKNWLVLFNAHAGQEILLVAGPPGKKRTLTWGTPFDNAVISMTKGSSAHNSSSLLRDWTNNKTRKWVTFLCIPPKSDLRFWSGYAAKMESAQTAEMRPGGGMQWRLKGVPKGTICLTRGLFTEESGKTLDKEEKSVDVQALLAECVKEYNVKGSPKLPADLSKPRKLGNGWDDAAIIDFYMDPSLTQKVAYPAT